MAVRRNVFLCIWVLYWLFLSVSSFQWVDPSIEKQDERNDAEIFQAIVTSMKEWEQQRLRKHSSNRLKREDPVGSVCYENLGCFESSGPYGYLDALPAKPEEINTKFWMYPGRRRRKSGSPPAEVPFEKLEEAFEWAKQGFNASLPTKVLIHGFGSDCSYIWVYEIRSALMAVEEVNIICVDWSNGAALPNYVKASANTRLVGKQLSLLLRGLVDKNGLSLRKTHLIGFSLGAHIAGFAGADLGNLSRITGLDPAGPLFESQDSRARLDQTDASFVDVIHSNGENLILGGLGSSQPMGHVDFYPNGGRMQKGCSHLFVGAVSDIIWSSPVEGRSLCNHRRAYKFFIDSVSPRCHFPAFPCESYEAFLDGKCFPCTGERTCGNMGYYADVSKSRGQLYLVTRDEEPFCAHQYLVKIETLPSPISIKSYGKIQITLIGESNLNETFMMTKKDDEEMKLGESISRILVPHPILAQLTRIEILYTAYTGWLSSGLTQWKMDKVTLMDSFGKMSSVCKKNLILESGTPVTLPLYPGECNLPHNPYEDDDVDVLTIEQTLLAAAANKSSFVPTQVVRLGPGDKPGRSFRDTNRLNLPWRNEKENDVDENETAESSRAFNTKAVKTAEGDIVTKEIVEPILKTHQWKNARSHDPTREKNEISEPILRPTTVKSTTTQRIDNATARVSNESSKPAAGLDQIANTVQFLPHRLAKMFEDAEKYAKETILPLVSTYTPKFISDIITPKEQQQKVIPLDYTKTQEVMPRSKSSEDLKSSESRSTTPLTHIQRINRKDDKEETPEDLAVAASEHASSSASYSVPSPSTTKKPEHVRPDNPLDAIVNTIQVLPRTLGGMLEQAERFTRTTVLPFVSNLTPRFISDWFSPAGSGGARFIPFSSGESFSGDEDQKPRSRRRRRRGNKGVRVKTRAIEEEGKGNETESTTYSHIQKIGKKTEGPGVKFDKDVVKEE